MKCSFQGPDQRDDGEMVIFFGDIDTRAVEDRKRMKSVLGVQIKDAPDEGGGGGGVKLKVN
jgi:hypothetical protein